MIALIIILFAATSLLSFLKFREEKTKRIIFFALGCMLFLLAGFRDGDAVRDYSNYVAMYNTGEGGEMSFHIVSWIVRYIFQNEVLFLFLIYALLGVSLKMTAIKELSSFWFLSIAIYISDFYILHELTQMRVGVASGFLLLCIKPLYNRDLRKFLLFSSAAIFFHYSAIPILLLWFFKDNKIYSYLYALLIPIAYLFYFLHINVVEVVVGIIPIEYIRQKFALYGLLQQQGVDSYSQINVFNWVFLARCLIYYILLWKKGLIALQNKYVVLLLKIEVISLCSFVLLAGMPVFAFRVSQFFGIVEVVLIPCICYVFKQKQVATAATVVVGLSLLLINLFYNHLIIA